MRPAHLPIVGLLAMSLVLSACGSDPTSPSDIPSTSSCSTKYSAIVNGTAWCAASVLGNYYAAQQQIVITGIGITGSTSWDITLSVASIGVVGQFNLHNVAPLRVALVSNNSGVGYSTNGTGGSGTITFTTLSTTHVVGTFTFTAPATSGGTGTATITNGSFDVTLVPG